MKKWILTIVTCAAVIPVIGKQYEANWDSLGNYEVPEWYQDAKFGIWPHWGIYSVPAFRGDHAAEWYGRWIHCVEKGDTQLDKKGRVRSNYFETRGMKSKAFHEDTYGPVGEFGYHDLIPLWKAEKWDPNAWAQLAVDSGAKFFCMMGMHHDGFALYDSDLTRWNSVGMGPKRNLVGEMRDASRKKGLKFGVSNHFAWNHAFFSYYHRNGLGKVQPELADFYSEGVVDQAYLERWWTRTIELVDKSDCDLYYFDWGWNSPHWRKENYHAKFASYLYNKGIETGKGTLGSPGMVLCSKQNDIPTDVGVRDLERRQMANIQKEVWQTDTSISVHSWGYSTEDEYRTADQLIDSLLDIISKNGVMMLNFGPKADGTVPAEYKQPLLEMGTWLKICGEAVYATRPFSIFGEGPNLKNQRGKHDHHTVYTGEHIRFTRNKENNVLYATALGWPGEKMLIKSLANADLSGIQSVQLLGKEDKLKWEPVPEGLEINMPNDPGYGMAYPIRIEFKKQVPSI